MASSKANRLATHPFKLVSTPAYVQKATVPYDPFVESASIMALSHNVLIRGLNTIYLQAPRISSRGDVEDFIAYAKCWAEVLDGHHEMEEGFLFPEIEKAVGGEEGRGIMEGCVEEHHAFLPGLQSYKTYLDQDAGSFDGKKLVGIIDDFAPLLFKHLEGEIPTLLSLKRFGDKVPLLKLMEQAGMKTTQHQYMTTGTSFFFRNLDLGFEDGRWAAWPPVPGPVWWVLQRTFVAWHKSWWRFASCDEGGRLRELEALEEGEGE